MTLASLRIRKGDVLRVDTLAADEPQPVSDTYRVILRYDDVSRYVFVVEFGSGAGHFSSGGFVYGLESHKRRR